MHCKSDELSLLKKVIPEAITVIKSLYTDVEKGLAMKKNYESKISLHEVFLEAVPTSFIYTFLFVRAFVGKNCILWNQTGFNKMFICSRPFWGCRT